tara:strand:+ start:4331 stop:5443 length:1113 start_codon:yes stop_codon:yes gene_type:complete
MNKRDYAKLQQEPTYFNSEKRAVTDFYVDKNNKFIDEAMSSTILPYVEEAKKAIDYTDKLAYLADNAVYYNDEELAELYKTFIYQEHDRLLNINNKLNNDKLKKEIVKAGHVAATNAVKNYINDIGVELKIGRNKRYVNNYIPYSGVARKGNKYESYVMQKTGKRITFDTYTIMELAALRSTLDDKKENKDSIDKIMTEAKKREENAREEKLNELQNKLYELQKKAKKYVDDYVGIEKGLDENDKHYLSTIEFLYTLIKMDNDELEEELNKLTGNTEEDLNVKEDKILIDYAQMVYPESMRDINERAADMSVLETLKTIDKARSSAMSHVGDMKVGGLKRKKKSKKNKSYKRKTLKKIKKKQTKKVNKKR